MTAKAYDGPVCYVGHDHEAADGRKLEGGWHYTVVNDGEHDSMPGEKLTLDAKGNYHLAKDGDKSHHEKHHKRLVTVAVMGDVGQPRTDEEIEAFHRHLDALEARIANDRLEPHEADHFLTTQKEIDVVRGWFNKEQT